MDLQTILSFIGAATLLALMPGPDNIYVLTESITKGKRNGIALALGLNSGVLIHTLAAATGLSLVLQQSAMAFQLVKYAGALYLFYLAMMTLKEKRILLTMNLIKHPITTSNFGKVYRKGFIMNVLNPKVSLFFIAFLPQFVNEGSMSITLQMIILGIIFMIVGFIIFSSIAILSGRLAQFLNNDKFWKTTKYVKASVLGVLGLALLTSEK